MPIGAEHNYKSGYHSRRCYSIVAANSNMAVPWYLMASYAYYHLDENIIDDALYDQLCLLLLEEWDTIVHVHKIYIDPEALTAGSGYNVNFSGLPRMTIGGVFALLREIPS